MHKNTYLLLTALAIFAALIVGINIGKNFQPKTPPIATTDEQSSSSTIEQSNNSSIPSPTPDLIMHQFISKECAIEFSYNKDFQYKEPATGSAVFSNTKDETDLFAFVCQKNIPRPALTKENIEEFKVGSISAKLYHDTNAKDGTPMDKFIFTNPKNKLDIFLSATNKDTLQSLISSIIIK